MAKKTSPRRGKPVEDLNLNNIVNTQFDAAARHIKLPSGLLEQIKMIRQIESAKLLDKWLIEQGAKDGETVQIDH